MIDQPTVEKIMDAAQIVDVVSDFVTLKKRGANYVGLCPFHDDKTPSMSVSPAKGIFKCFACGKAGNAVGFVMEHEQMTFPEALRYLAGKYHIEVHEKEMSEEERQSQTERESLFVVNQFARDYFQEMLHQSSEGRSVGLAYFRNRGFRDDIIEKFQLGYAPEGRDGLAKEALKKGYKKEYLVKTGLCIENDNHQLRDRFYGRVMFPFHSLSGKIVAFGGRVLSKETKGISQKYVNSPESEIFVKGSTLYGLYYAKQAIVKKDRCYLVEGYTDVISMHQSGLENVVASSGTALTEMQIKLIHRFTNNITLLYDGDEAGIHAALRGTDLLLAEGMNVKVCLLPDGDDPDSFARKHNATEFQDFVQTHETDFIRFKTQLLMGDAGNDPIKKANLIGSLMESVSVIPDAITRDIYIKECSELLQMDNRMLVNEIAKRREKRMAEESERRARERNREKGEEDDVPPPMPVEEAEQTQAPEKIKAKENPAFEKYESQLMQVVVRYGEKIMCKTNDSEGKTIEVSVIDFITDQLQQDGLTLQNPIYQRILVEAQKAQAQDAGFIAEHYFVNHPDIEISQTCSRLISSRYQLSKYHYKNQTVVGDEDRLLELVPNLIYNFKYATLASRINELMRQIQNATMAKDESLCNTLMKEYSGLTSIKNALAQKLGERVILNL